jgi:hypothetical protein
MSNKKNWLGMLRVGIIFVIVIIVFGGCSKNADRRLNGTWVNEDSTISYKCNYNSGTFEDTENGILIDKGTYTTNDGKISFVLTHFYGTQLDLEARWYTEDELKAAGFDWVSEFFSRFPLTSNYTIDGNTLTTIHENENGETSIVTMTREGKPITAGKSSGSPSALAGRWYLDEGPTRNNPEEMDLLKDGTGIVDGAGVTWKIENGRFYLINPMKAFSSIYNVTSSTLILTKDDGVKLKYKKR